MNTKTAPKFELKRTPVSSAQSEIIFGGAANPNFADPRTRLIFSFIETNAHGEHVAHITVARSIDYAENPVSELLVRDYLASSPVFTVIDDAHEWIAKAEPWVVANVRQTFGGMSEFPVVRESHTHCSGCGHFDTLSTEQQAWCDVTRCSTESCSYENIYMIGD
jgi:hypothetical protein